VAISAVAGAGAGVITNVVTAHPNLALWIGLGVLVIAGVGSQVWLSTLDGSPVVAASGAGSVAVGGSVKGGIRTRVSGRGSVVAVPGDLGGVVAGGAGSVSVAGDVEGPVNTDVRGREASS
jgi:hypothetical protein